VTHNHTSRNIVYKNILHPNIETIPPIIIRIIATAILLFYNRIQICPIEIFAHAFFLYNPI